MNVLYDRYWGKYPLSVEYLTVHHVFRSLLMESVSEGGEGREGSEVKRAGEGRRG